MRRRFGIVGTFLASTLLACTSPPQEGSGGGSGGRSGSGGAPPANSGSGAPSSGGGSGLPEPDGSWRKANLTNFESYPDPGSEECIRYNGCKWAGLFSFLPGKQSETWVMMNNIAAVHARHAETYKLKTLRLRQDGRIMDVKVYDLCSDNDCNGCCTDNSRETGFLIDIEKYTMQRFGSGEGIVEWKCLDCD